MGDPENDFNLSRTRCQGQLRAPEIASDWFRRISLAGNLKVQSHNIGWGGDAIPVTAELLKTTIERSTVTRSVSSRSQILHSQPVAIHSRTNCLAPTCSYKYGLSSIVQVSFSLLPFFPSDFFTMFSASIAFTFFLSLSGIALSAPMVS